MSDLAGQTAQQLFRRWQNGDGDAGQAMAQRFSDWYYAISASRLGDIQGRDPLQKACARFAQGVAEITSAGDLAKWAHGIIHEEIDAAGGRAESGDFPNAVTNQRSPVELLEAAGEVFDAKKLRLLAHAYDKNHDIEAVKSEAEESGGYPQAVLEARYSLKRWLRDEKGVAFTEIPETANRDWGPLPLYEGGRMVRAAEERAFETWMLSDLGLCKDIAEFAAFAIALRGGVFSQTSPAVAAPAPAPSPAPAAAPSPAPIDKPSGGMSPLIFVVGGVVLLIVVIALVLLLS